MASIARFHSALESGLAAAEAGAALGPPHLLFGVIPPFVKNCTLSREPGSNTAPELLWRGFRDSLDQIEDLSSVSPVDPDLRPIPPVISGLAYNFLQTEEWPPLEGCGRGY
jgi:hypothetical protein